MERKRKWFYPLKGTVPGALLAFSIWMCFCMNTHAADSAKSFPVFTAADTQSSVPAPQDAWDRSAVYTGGDTVNHQGRQYRAKWWTLGEQPGHSDVWEDLGLSGHAAPQPNNADSLPFNPSLSQDRELSDFKVVGYYPSWKPDKFSSIDFSIVTHICYAFAIPRPDGSLLDLENPDTARELLRLAHDKGTKVLLSVGGWSHNGTPLESVFMEATSTDAGRNRLAENILAMCEEYGFDGVDMDWEHPRTDGASAKQYEALMLTLADMLHKKGKLLTAAVISGATPDGNIYYDAAAHSDTVLNTLDFINVMAYDGGDGERHSSYSFALDCGTYWKETRGLPSHKVVLGLPFYARPSWADYGTVLKSVPTAWDRDHTLYNGMEVYITA